MPATCSDRTEHARSGARPQRLLRITSIDPSASAISHAVPGSGNSVGLGCGRRWPAWQARRPRAAGRRRARAGWRPAPTAPAGRRRHARASPAPRRRLRHIGRHDQRRRRRDPGSAAVSGTGCAAPGVVATQRRQRPGPETVGERGHARRVRGGGPVRRDGCRLRRRLRWPGPATGAAGRAQGGRLHRPGRRWRFAGCLRRPS